MFISRTVVSNGKCDAENRLEVRSQKKACDPRSLPPALPSSQKGVLPLMSVTWPTRGAEAVERSYSDSLSLC